MYVDGIANYFGATKDRPADAPEMKVADRSERRSDAGQRKARTLVNAFEAIIDAYPDDIEAKAFLVNQLWLNQRYAGIKISSRAANQALLDQVFVKNPMHPARHYQIHLWDSKATAKRAEEGALSAGLTGPGIAHLWHMEGHIWWQLGRRMDSAWSQEASARVDHAHMMRDRVMPDEIHNYAHNNEWLIRSLRSVGRIGDALDLAKNMVELPRHPKVNSFTKRGSASYGADRLRELLDWFELWDEALRLEGTMYLTVGGSPDRQAKVEALLAMAKYEKGDHVGIGKHADAIEALIETEKKARASAADKAEFEALEAGQKDEQVDKAMAAAQKSHSRTIRRLSRTKNLVAGWLLMAEGKTEEGIQKLKAGRLKDVHLARLQLRAGNTDEALKLAKKAEKSGKAVNANLAVLAWVQHEAGKGEEAKASFEKLREESGFIDLDAPQFARLEPIAKSLGHGADWRVRAPKTATARRYDLEKLGPFRWSPMSLPSEWELPDGDGKLVSSKQFRGRPHLVVFFLGFDCLHCVDQLKALKPLAERYEKAGIDIVTIGSVDPKHIADSAKKRPFPFPILADPKLEVFKKWRVHDDFENLELHGTFLVDADGFVRWQDISYEPFMEVDWLLGESQRLLSLPARHPMGAGGGSK